jgi:hypothetical protein
VALVAVAWEVAPVIGQELRGTLPAPLLMQKSKTTGPPGLLYWKLVACGTYDDEIVGVVASLATTALQTRLPRHETVTNAPTIGCALTSTLTGIETHLKSLARWSTFQPTMKYFVLQ